MSDHYYSQQPKSSRSPETWKFTLRQKEYTFTSDGGVFSKHTVDFGSRLLIETFAMPQVAGDVLDLGCGYGPIGIAVAGAYPDRHIVMADINERAIMLAKENVLQNNVTNIEIIQSDGLLKLENRLFAAILTNPPIRAGKKVVHMFFEESKRHLVKGGELWIVIQKKQGAPSAMKKLETLFSSVEIVIRKKGYYILRAVNN